MNARIKTPIFFGHLVKKTVKKMSETEIILIEITLILVFVYFFLFFCWDYRRTKRDTRKRTRKPEYIT